MSNHIPGTFRITFPSSPTNKLILLFYVLALHLGYSIIPNDPIFKLGDVPLKVDRDFFLLIFIKCRICGRQGLAVCLK